MDPKEHAAVTALNYVHDGMVLGLGTGSTTNYFIDYLGKHIRDGLVKDIKAVPTSNVTAERAGKNQIPLTTLAETYVIDLAVDGADEVDERLNLIKGLGRALLREKIVEIHAEQFIVVVDESKVVSRLGLRGPLPVEITKFEAQAQIRWLNTLGCRAELWQEDDGNPIVTDNENYLVRCWFEQNGEPGIVDPYTLSRKLADRAGIVEHGLFLDMATMVIVAGSEGVEIMQRPTT